MENDVLYETLCWIYGCVFEIGLIFFYNLFWNWFSYFFLAKYCRIIESFFYSTTIFFILHSSLKKRSYVALNVSLFSCFFFLCYWFWNLCFLSIPLKGLCRSDFLFECSSRLFFTFLRLKISPIIVFFLDFESDRSANFSRDN